LNAVVATLGNNGWRARLTGAPRRTRCSRRAGGRTFPGATFRRITIVAALLLVVGAPGMPERDP
jgi:hypothetical protein